MLLLRQIHRYCSPRLLQSLRQHKFIASRRLASSLTPSIAQRVQRIIQEDASNNPTKAQRVLQHLEQKRQAALEEISILYELQNDSAGDIEAEQECLEELTNLQSSIQDMESKIVDALLEARDNEDNDGGTDAIIEVRAGTGGDEASLFAQELMESYKNSAKRCKFAVELLSETYTALGGIRESSISITGSAYGGDVITPYEFFRFESGVHRVQRVPVNDTRIHTSACSVAVLPQQASGGNNPSMDIPPSELQIETMRASGAGGQHVNCTDSAVRITHLPTGTTVSIQDERSQHKNKEKAMKLITARVRDAQQLALAAERFQKRSSLLGRGDRHERIRTFNYPQDRVTDHRCKETRHGISSLLAGDKDEGLVATFLPLLRDMRRQEQLRELEEEE